MASWCSRPSRPFCAFTPARRVKFDAEGGNLRIICHFVPAMSDALLP
jgi:hypothetical protein